MKIYELFSIYHYEKRSKRNIKDIIIILIKDIYKI